MGTAVRRSRAVAAAGLVPTAARAIDATAAGSADAEFVLEFVEGADAVMRSALDVALRYALANTDDHGVGPVGLWVGVNNCALPHPDHKQEPFSLQYL